MNRAVPPAPRGRLRAGAAHLVFAALILFMAYLAWRPRPHAQTAFLMPRALGAWFDRHDFIRNLAGFSLLAAAAFVSSRSARLGHLKLRSGRIRWVVADGTTLVGLMALVVALETVQLNLPRRSFDWLDIASGWLGIGWVWLAACGCRRQWPIRAEPASSPFQG